MKVLGQPRHLGLASAVFLLSCFMIEAQPSTTSNPSHEQGDAAVRSGIAGTVERSAQAFLHHYIATLEAGDEQAVRALFVDEGRLAWFTDGSHSYGSPEDVLTGMRRFAGIQFRTRLSDISVMQLTTELVSATSSFETTLTFPDAEPYAFGGVITWLLETADTEAGWKVLLGHTSTPRGPPSDSS